MPVYFIQYKQVFYSPKESALALTVWVPLVRVALISLVYWLWFFTPLRTVTFIWWVGAKVPYFFFRGKDWGVLTHSIWAIFVFFYFPILEKKNKLFFFPRKSLQATHSPERRSSSKKRSKPVKNGTFCRISVFFVVFFSQKISQNSVFFFPGKDYTSLTHSNFRAGKKKQPRKKKQQFYSLTRFSPKKYKF